MKWFKRKKAQRPICLEIISVDNAPDDLAERLPVALTIIRRMPGPDRPDYWLAKLEKALSWNGKRIDYLIVGPRFVGASMQRGMERMALNIAYVIDESLLKDERLDFQKCAYIAIGIGQEKI